MTYFIERCSTALITYIQGIKIETKCLCKYDLRQ